MSSYLQQRLTESLPLTTFRASGKPVVLQQRRRRACARVVAAAPSVQEVQGAEEAQQPSFDRSVTADCFLDWDEVSGVKMTEGVGYHFNLTLCICLTRQ